MKMTGAQALVRWLEDQGIEVAFGCCGHGNIGFLDALLDSRIRFVSCPHEQIAVMVSGKLRLAVGDEETVMGPGDMVLIPSNTPHEAEALEDTVVMDIFSPPREDFLSGEGPAYMNK